MDSWLKGLKFESPQGRQEKKSQLPVLTLIPVSVRAVLLQKHVKDPGHSANSEGGRMQLNTHTPYVRDFEYINKCQHKIYTKFSMICLEITVWMPAKRWLAKIMHIVLLLLNVFKWKFSCLLIFTLHLPHKQQPFYVYFMGVVNCI